MKAMWIITAAAVLAGCGVETVGTAATAAKLQADQAKNLQQVDKAKADVEAAMAKSEERLKQAAEN